MSMVTRPACAAVPLFAFVCALPAAEPIAADRPSASVARTIDQWIDKKLAAAEVRAAALADDADFLRRACLDIQGKIPTRARTRAFLDDVDPDKRRKLIDELLADAAYGQHFGRLWRDRLANEETVGGSRRDALATWLAHAFNANRGWDTITTDILTATGAAPATTFAYNHLDDGQPRPNRLAAATARLFLGNQLQCAECHDHPYADWKQTDLWKLSAFFARVYMSEKEPKGIQEQPGGPPKTRFGPPPVTPAADGSIKIPADAGPGAGTVVAARFLSGDTPPLPADGGIRPLLAQWVSAADNPYFAKAAVNRFWAHFFGRGFVNPVDDLHEGNPPSHPELLDALAKEFQASGHDLKHLIRCICNSAAYQRTARKNTDVRPDAEGQEDPQLALFGRMRFKVMSAEAMYDSVLTAAAAAKMSKHQGRGDFVRFFTTREVDGDPTEFTDGIPQVLFLLNDKWVNTPPELVAGLVRAKTSAEAGIEEIFLATLNRRPTKAETDLMTDYLKRRGDAPRGWAGVWWILVNSEAFMQIP